MDTPLPKNETLVAFGNAIPWQEIERQKRRFNDEIRSLRDSKDDVLPLDALSDAIGAPVTAFYETSDRGNILLGHIDGQPHVIGSLVSKRYRKGKTLPQSIVSYNLNPSVNHTNIQETEQPSTRMRALGAEIELGLFHPDGSGPTEAQVQDYIHLYQESAHRLGITPHVDREACQYQVEAHVAPGIGYHRTSHSLDGIMNSLVVASEATGLKTAILSVYPLESDFRLTDDPKVHTAADLMKEVNGHFPEYVRLRDEAVGRYGMSEDSHIVQVFRIQGCHIHLDLAGRSESLGMLAFYTMLRSATAVANSAVLKGGAFVNGTCDSELLCAREYLRRTTVTGRQLEVPLSPHLSEDGINKFGNLLRMERANGVGRAHLYEDGLGEPISAMHNPMGRLRSDLGTSKRICTLESTGLPVNPSASRMAAVLTDFAFSHAIIEDYFRQYGCDLEPMYEDRTLLALLGPLSSAEFRALNDASDRDCTDITLTTAAGTQMSLAEFYEMKRLYMHRQLPETVGIAPRDIDDVYMSLQRMLNPPSGRQAQTIEQYMCDPMLRSSGNWGRILRSAFEEEGGVPGTHNPDAVLAVTMRVHEALRKRYTQE